MKTTVELPDDLFWQANPAAVLRRRKFDDLVEEGLRRVLESPEVDRAAPAQRPTLHALMKECCGMIDSGMSDLATNLLHMN